LSTIECNCCNKSELEYELKGMNKDKEQSKFWQLDDILKSIGDQDYFLDFMHTKNIDAGIIRLRPEENDTQEPHSADELYCVIEGTGKIEINGYDTPVRQGTIIFVPAKSRHRFHSNKEDLVILYMFGG
jgi:mannose-6-phosphate isomerase-like protein (cupin superfamily)